MLDKKSKIKLYLLIIPLVLAACSPAGTIPEYTLMPGNAGTDYNVAGEISNIKSVSLYYPDSRLKELVRIVSQIQILEGGGEAGAILRKLLGNPNEADYTAPFRGQGSLAWSVVTRSVAIVNIVGDFAQLSEREIFASLVSVTNTLCQLNNVEYVEILLNGNYLTKRGLISSPMSAMKDSLSNLYLKHMDIINNPQDYNNQSSSKYILYYMDISGDYLLAEVRSTNNNESLTVKDVFNKLKSSPQYGSGMMSCIPTNVIMSSDPIYSEDSDGNIVLTIDLEAPKHDTMDNKTRYMIAGALTLSVQGHFTEVDTVRININGQPALNQISLTSGTFQKSIGELVVLYFPDVNYRSLIRVQRAMGQDRCYSAKECLLEMLDHEEFGSSDTVSSFPPYTRKEDILNVVLNQGCAVVDISHNIMNELYMFSDDAQRMFVYSIVNTLTEFDNINTVHIIVEGRVVEKIDDSIYIESPLMPNKGIVYN